MGAVMTLLVVSFAIWGIGDIFRGFGRSTLAKVGGTEIGIEQFRQIYNDRLHQFSRQVGRPISSEQARALGLDRQILGQLLAESALDERARQLRLNLSDQEIARQIMSDPNFRDPSGQFDRLRFEQLIRSAGFTEPRYTAEQKRTSLRRQLVDSVSGDVAVPKALLEAVNKYENELRSIEYVTLNSSAAGEIPAPTPEELAKYYDAHKGLFRAPEYRNVVLLSITPADLAKKIEVSDEDAKHAYDSQRGKYETPERRHVEQIVFANADEARAARERIAAGLTFAALASERGLGTKDIDLGLVAKSALVDRNVAEAAFALEDGGVSAPVQGQFGSVLVYVDKIEPGHVRPYEEVAAEIKKELATERAKGDLQTLRDKVEDELAAGQRLTEIAPKLNLQARTIEAVDRSGRDPGGQLIANLPPGADVVTNVFGSDVGVENDALQIPGGGFVWYDVLGITPSHDRQLEDVKPQVEARWRDEQIAERLKSKAQEMVDKLKGGATLAGLAAADNLKVETASGLKRGRATSAVPAQVVDNVFKTAKDAPGSAEGQNPTEQIVFRVTDIAVPAFDPNSVEARRIADVVRNRLSEDLFGQYIAQLESDLGTSINEDAFRRIAGNEPN
jgi:peptidyl-prolyl cis-trans isomerase D